MTCLSLYPVPLVLEGREELDELTVTELVDLAACMSISAYDEGTRRAAEAKRNEAYRALEATLTRLYTLMNKLALAGQLLEGKEDGRVNTSHKNTDEADRHGFRAL